MYRKIVIFLIVILNSFIMQFIITHCYDDINENIEELNVEFAEDRVIVGLKNDMLNNFKNFTVADFREIECKDVKELASISNNANILRTSCNKILLVNLKDSGKENVKKAIEILKKRDDILYVEPDYKITLCSDEIVEAQNIDNRDWAINNLSLKKCWNITTGISDVTVGVIDTGIDQFHPDLSDSIDENLSKDFTSNEMSNIGSFDDSIGHGTKVAGIIAANYNELSTIGGVCPNIKLVSLKAFNADNTYSSVVLSAIEYASEMNIDILNLSAGWKANTSYYSQSIESAISSFNGLFVCTAGNKNEDIDNGHAFYPACYTLDNIICVGALDKSDVRYTYLENNELIGSSYGSESVDIYAPGENIYTTKSGGGYEYGRNTSMAAPFVTGVAAMLLSIDKNLEASDLKSLILNNSSILLENLGYGENSLFPSYIRKINPFATLLAVLDTENIVLNLNGSLSYSNIIDSNSTDFYNRNIFIKLNVDSYNIYDIFINGTNQLSYTIYDIAFNKLDADVHLLNNELLLKSTISLNEDVYYIKVYYEDESYSDLISIDINQHIHDYDCTYQWYNNNMHKKLCCCNAYELEGHAVLKGTNRCILCNGIADTGFIGVDFLNCDNVIVTQNGSYQLPNGVIILSEYDVESYLNHTLTFYKIKKNVGEKDEKN